jgi:hypothetical protein
MGKGEIRLSCFEKGSERKCVADFSFDRSFVWPKK